MHPVQRHGLILQCHPHSTGLLQSSPRVGSGQGPSSLHHETINYTENPMCKDLRRNTRVSRKCHSAKFTPLSVPSFIWKWTKKSKLSRWWWTAHKHKNCFRTFYIHSNFIQVGMKKLVVDNVGTLEKKVGNSANCHELSWHLACYLFCWLRANLAISFCLVLLVKDWCNKMRKKQEICFWWAITWALANYRVLPPKVSVSDQTIQGSQNTRQTTTVR